MLSPFLVHSTKLSTVLMNVRNIVPFLAESLAQIKHEKSPNIWPGSHDYSLFWKG